MDHPKSGPRTIPLADHFPDHFSWSQDRSEDQDKPAGQDMKSGPRTTLGPLFFGTRHAVVRVVLPPYGEDHVGPTPCRTGV